MKKWIFSIVAVVALSSVAIFASERFNQGELTLAQLENIEALAQEEVEIICSRPPYGRCYIKSLSGYCIYSGYTVDYCC